MFKFIRQVLDNKCKYILVDGKTITVIGTMSPTEAMAKYVQYLTIYLRLNPFTLRVVTLAHFNKDCSKVILDRITTFGLPKTLDRHN